MPTELLLVKLAGENLYRVIDKNQKGVDLL